MSKTPYALLAVLTVSLGACAPVSGDIAVLHYRAPLGPWYVYAFRDGSCWADDLWYGACPWNVGARYGYHYFYEGFYYWQPDTIWYSIVLPPPWQWRVDHHRHHRHHHRVMPPRGRRR